MKVICAWCKEPQGEKKPLENKETTHTICPECSKKFDIEDEITTELEVQ